MPVVGCQPITGNPSTVPRKSGWQLVDIPLLRVLEACLCTNEALHTSLLSGPTP